MAAKADRQESASEVGASQHPKTRSTNTQNRKRQSETYPVPGNQHWDKRGPLADNTEMGRPKAERRLHILRERYPTSVGAYIDYNWRLNRDLENLNDPMPVIAELENPEPVDRQRVDNRMPDDEALRPVAGDVEIGRAFRQLVDSAQGEHNKAFGKRLGDIEVLIRDTAAKADDALKGVKVLARLGNEQAQRAQTDREVLEQTTDIVDTLTTRVCELVRHANACTRELDSLQETVRQLRARITRQEERIAALESRESDRELRNLRDLFMDGAQESVTSGKRSDSEDALARA